MAFRARILGKLSPASRKRIWISAEIREEIEDILHMIAAAPRRWSEVRIDAPASVLSDMSLPPMVGNAKVVVVAYEHSIAISKKSKIVGFASFFGRILRRRPSLIISGFSMMKHRVTSGILAIPHIAYIRGVAFDASVSVGISDKVRFGGLSRFVPRRVVATYSADSLLTVGEVNRRFLIDRGNKAEDVFVCGPLWLEGAEQGGNSKQDGAFAYFVTGAWEAHGRLEEHEAQLALIRRLAQEWSGAQLFALRIHPRDRFDYETDPLFSGVRIDRELPGDFLANLGNDDVLIAPLSTLAFEALYLCKGVVFYSDEKATKAYFHVYEALGITPASAAELVAGTFKTTTDLETEVFTAIDSTAFARAIDHAEERFAKR